MWLTASSILYVWRSCKKKNINKSQKQFLQMAILASALTLPRLFLTHLLFWIGYNDNEENQTCEILLDISEVAFVMVYVTVYLFLWWRQRYIYRQPSIASINTKTIKILSWACLTCFILGSTAVIFLFLKDARHQSTSIGCYVRTNVTVESKKSSFIAYVFSSVGIVIAQISVFTLILYPLIRHYNLQIEQTNIETSSSASSVAFTKSFSSYSEHNITLPSTNYPAIFQTTNGNIINTSKEKVTKNSRHKSSQTSSMQRLHRVIKRNVACALGCIIADLSVLTVVGIIIGDTQPRYFTKTIFDISMVLRILFFLISFDNYKGIFCCMFQCENLF